MKVKNVIWTIDKILICLLILILDFYLLIRFDYLNNLIYVDNFLGCLPLYLMILFSVCGFILVWKKHTKEQKIIPIILVFWMVASAALFPNSLRKNWTFGKEVTDVGGDIGVEEYAPFVEETKSIKLDETPAVMINEDMPILDGSFALYPVYSAIAQNIYNKDNYNGEVVFNNTVRGFNALVAGDVDIFFSAKPSKKQYEYAKEHNKEIYLTPIGLEAFVFVVPKSNPINDLSSQQIKNIYSGKTDYWRTLGWNEGGKILKFQRPEGSGSQTLLQYIMGDLPIESPQPAPSLEIIGSNNLMEQITVQYKNVQPALGYTFKFFSQVMSPNPDSKLLSIDGIEPSSINICNGTYKYRTEFYAVTIGEPKGNNKKVIDWVLSSQGQSLIELSGYSKI